MENPAPLTPAELHVLMHFLHCLRGNGDGEEVPQEHWPRSAAFAEVTDEMLTHFETMAVTPVAGPNAMPYQAVNYLLYRLSTLRDETVRQIIPPRTRQQ